MEDVRAAREKQRRAALDKGNEIRRERAVLKQKLKAGEVDPWALLRGESAEHEPAIESWTLQQILACIPGIGPARIHEILMVFKASPLLKVAGLSDERRVELARIARSAVDIVPSDYEQRG